MKVNKLICLDSQIVEKLQQEKNASKIINELLNEYYTTGGKLEKSKIINQIQNKEMQIANLNHQIYSLKEKLQSITKNEKYLKDVFKELPDDVLEDFKKFPKLNKETLINRYNNIYKNKFNFSIDTLFKAFDEYFKQKK